MPAASDRATLVAALEAVWSSLATLGDSLSPEEWDVGSDCPGWTIRDCFSHVIGTELMLLGRGEPALEGDAPHVRNDIGRFNEGGIAARRDRSGTGVLAEFRSVTGERLTALGSMSEAEFDAESFTPAGPDTYGRFMQIRTFDCWIHEQDVRGPLGRPGHDAGPAVDVALDEHATALGFVVGKRAGATEGQSVRLRLTGPTSRTLDVRVDGRAQLVDDLVDPTCTIELPTLTWFRIAAGRRPADLADPELRIEGDRALAESVLANAAYTI